MAKQGGQGKLSYAFFRLVKDGDPSHYAVCGVYANPVWCSDGFITARNRLVDGLGLMTLYDHISESVFTAQVIKLAQVFKWRVAHFRPAMDKHGRWKTAVQGDGAGFPDLIMVRQERVLVAELKSAKGKPSREQLLWISGFLVAGVEAFIWKPSDINDIEEILK